MKMTESEKKEIERIQAKIMNTAAIIVGCAAIILSYGFIFMFEIEIVPFVCIQNIRQPILRKYQEGPEAVPVCH